MRKWPLQRSKFKFYLILELGVDGLEVSKGRKNPKWTSVPSKAKNELLGFASFISNLGDSPLNPSLWSYTEPTYTSSVLRRSFSGSRLTWSLHRPSF
ncbi:hypothetical protein ACLB2K_059347 [Fragaria x ananassa]